MKLLEEVCFGPRNNPLNNPDYDLDHAGLRFGERGGVIQSLNDCLVIDRITIAFEVKHSIHGV